jgi:hypothetical protein
MDAHEMKRRGRGISRDMSPEGIARRLDIVGELWRMWRVLRQARPRDPARRPEARGRSTRSDPELMRRNSPWHLEPRAHFAEGCGDPDAMSPGVSATPTAHQSCARVA